MIGLLCLGSWAFPIPTGKQGIPPGSLKEAMPFSSG